ncbi:immunoglobulin iota chain-like [Choloepus didactylus]|uniref:immunoglobulin iota chain-like n=1 Tax=Choloepus didactylus TaxID=27675 RepID=UPI00189CA3C5|nr:immunoglobulin iota chain-like [Choloepus didactylus]
MSSWKPVLLLLLTHYPGGAPQPVLEQPPAASAPLGTTVRIPCTFSGNYSIGLHGVFWYQQKPGHPPRFLLRYPLPSDGSRGPKIPPRFSGSKDVASNTGFLSISELQPEDEAVYFCAVGSSSMDRDKGGTQLTVLGGPKASPKVYLFAPSAEELATDKATLVCLVIGFYPGILDVQWKKDGSVISQGVETPRPSKQADNKYAASSYLALTGSEWKAGRTYSCQVTHEGSTIEKKVAAANCS